MADDNPIFQMVQDPDFGKLPVAEQRKALTAHDPTFGQVGDDDLNKFVQAHQGTHQAMPSGNTADTQYAAQHTGQGTGTDAGSRMRQISEPPGALVSPREIANTMLATSTIGSRVPEMGNADPYQGLKDAAQKNEDRGGPKGVPGMLADTMDFASSQTTPTNLALLGGGALTKAVPAAGLITKPLMAAAGLTFAGEGGKDIYDAATDTDGDPRDRLRKGLNGAAGVAGGIAGLGEVSPGPEHIGNFETGIGDAGVRGMFNQKMDIASPNEPFTPRELLSAARDHGINLDLADASGAGVPKMVKHATMHGLAGSGPFEANLEHNVGALDQWGSQYLDGLSKFSGEQAGARIQDALKNDYAQRKTAASTEFEDLDKRVGPNSIDGTATVEAEAVKIRDGMKQYYDRHPELMPKQAWSIINDLAERPATAGANGQQVAAKANNFSWSELHQLRSDLMDIYRNNPDLTKSRADAWLQQMVKTIDDTMTGAASNLSPADKWQFRQANETWEGLKSTYDNPAHPLYHAVRAQSPSQVTNMLLNTKAPEFARQMKSTLGPEFGDLQRAAAEKILGQDKTGAGYDFRTMPGRLKNYPPQYINDLMGPQGARDLALMSRTGMTVTRDINPSGSGKLLQKSGELAALSAGGTAALLGHPLPLALEAGGMVGSRIAAKGMNHPGTVDLMTDPRSARAMPRGLPIASGAETMNEGEDQLARRVMRRRPEISAP